MKQNLIFLFLLCSFSMMAQNPDWIYLSKGSVVSIAEEGNYLWMGSRIGAIKMNKTTGAKINYDKTNSPFSDDWISNILVDQNGIKWMGTGYDGDLFRFDDVNWAVYDTSNSPLNGYGIANLELDTSNNIWLSTNYTNGGLFKFDGVTWTQYDSSNTSLPSNYISSIYCDNNIIWVGTNFGLSKFDGSTWTHYNSSNSNLTQSNIYSMDKDSNGNLWLQHSYAIQKFNGSSFSWYDNTNTNLPNSIMTSISIDSNNVIWVGCREYTSFTPVLGGLMTFDGSTWAIYDTLNSGIGTIACSPVFVDKSNEIWYGTKQGMVGKKNSTWTQFNPSKSELATGTVRQTEFDDMGNVLIATLISNKCTYGLLKHDWQSWQQLSYYDDYSYGISSNNTANVYVKNSDALQKFDGINWTTVAGTPDLDNLGFNIDLSCIELDSNGNIWMDYFSGVGMEWDPFLLQWVPYGKDGLAYYDGVTWVTFDFFNSNIPNSNINDIKIDNDNHVWLATDSGLVEYDGVNWIRYNTSNSTIPFNWIRDITIDNSNNIWFTVGPDLCKFDKINTTIYTHPIPNYSLTGKVEADLDGSLWMINSYNLIHFDGVNWTTFTSNNSPLPRTGSTLTLSIDQLGNKWIGTQTGVLVYKQGGVQFPVIPELDEPKAFSIFPNPVKDELTVYGGETIINELKIIDIRGRVVMSISQPSISINVRDLAVGSYVIELNTSKGVITHKFIKQ